MNTARIALVGLALVSIAACSAAKSTSIADSSDGGADAGATDAAAIYDGPLGRPDEPQKDASAPDAPVGECSSSPTQTSCVSCCSKAHQDGAGAYLLATIDCMCVEEKCAKECEATLCNTDTPKNPDAECSSCVSAKNAQCAQAVKAACTAEPDCVAFDACVSASDCTIKTN